MVDVLLSIGLVTLALAYGLHCWWWHRPVRNDGRAGADPRTGAST